MSQTARSRGGCHAAAAARGSASSLTATYARHAQDYPRCLREVTLARNVPCMAEPETLLTTAEAANVLNVSPQTISRWVSIGRLQPIRKLPGLRGAFLFSPDDVAALRESA